MKISLLFTALSIALSLLPESSFAQNDWQLSGKVTSPDGTPIPGIMVCVSDQEQQGAVTDSQGAFAIRISSHTGVQVHFKGLGYESKLIDLEPADAGREEYIQVILEEVNLGLDEVLVTGRKETSYTNSYSFIGTKTESRIIDVPQTISSVTKELIADKQAFQITEVTGNLAGVNQYSAYDDLAIRGFRNGWESGFRLVNGLRSGYGYGTSFFRVPLTVNIESIEVLKGPGAVLFGDVSPGGTVNLVTKKPLDEYRMAVNFSAGSFNTLRTTLDITGPLNEKKNLLYRFNVGYEDSKTFRDVNQRKSLMIAPTVTFVPTDRTTFNVELTYTSFDGYLDRGIGIRGGDLYAMPRSFTLSQPSDYYRVNDIALNASVNHQFSKAFSLNAGYMKFIYHEDLAEHRTLNTYADAPANTIINLRYVEKKIHETTENITLYLSLKKEHGHWKHQLIGGMDYAGFSTDKTGHQWESRSQIINGEQIPLTFDLNNPSYELRNTSAYSRMPISPFFIDYLNTGYQTTGWYAQDQVKIAKKLQVLLGLRHERFTDQRQFDQEAERILQKATTPRLGITYKLAEQLNFFAGYNQGFKPLAPQYIRNPENYGADRPFRPEASLQYETGLKTELFKKQLFGSLSLYHIERKDMLVGTGQVTESGNPIYRQVGQIRSQGIETEWAGNIFSHTSISFNYAYNLTKILNSDLESEIGMPASNAPKHAGGIWLKHSFQIPSLQGFGFGIGGNYVGKRRMEIQAQDTNGTMFWDFWPEYAQVDLALFYQVDRFKLGLNCNNLFDTYYFVGGYDHHRAFPGTPRTAMISFNYMFD